MLLLFSVVARGCVRVYTNTAGVFKFFLSPVLATKSWKFKTPLLTQLFKLRIHERKEVCYLTCFIHTEQFMSFP